MKYLFLICFSLSLHLCIAQNYGSLPDLSAEELRLDFELFRQGLEKYHTGIYWYTPKAQMDAAFDKAEAMLDRPMNVLEFNKVLAPLVALTREDHCNIYLPGSLDDHLGKSAIYFPFVIKFLDGRMYIIQNGSDQEGDPRGKEIIAINGESIPEIVGHIGGLFASDGFAKAVKYSDLDGFNFSYYYYLYSGLVDSFDLILEEDRREASFKALTRPEIRGNLKKNRPATGEGEREVEAGDEEGCLEYTILSDSIAYLGIHSFSNSTIKENAIHKRYKKFLKYSFGDISEREIKHLIIDVSQNGGGNEGNENRLYSYIGNNFQKYAAVNAKTQKIVLDNGVDESIKVKTFSFWERMFANRRLEDGSFTRRAKIGFGLNAYKKEPAVKYTGKAYLMTSPITYSGGSEFASMFYDQERGQVFGEETGGGYYGNTSGYSFELPLPHSGIAVEIPALQFMMNVSGLPEGSPVVPHHRIIPGIEEYLAGDKVVRDSIVGLIQAGGKLD